jgi:hypothetical protein
MPAPKPPRFHLVSVGTLGGRHYTGSMFFNALPAFIAVSKRASSGEQATATTDQLRTRETNEPVSKRADCARKRFKCRSLQPQAAPTHDKLANLGPGQPRAPSATQAAPYESRAVALHGAETPKDFSSLLLVAEIVEEFATESECRARRVLRQNRIETGWVLLRPKSRTRRRIKRASET